VTAPPDLLGVPEIEGPAFGISYITNIPNDLNSIGWFPNWGLRGHAHALRRAQKIRTICNNPRSLNSRSEHDSGHDSDSRANVYIGRRLRVVLCRFAAPLDHDKVTIRCPYDQMGSEQRCHFSSSRRLSEDSDRLYQAALRYGRRQTDGGGVTRATRHAAHLVANDAWQSAAAGAYPIFGNVGSRRKTLAR
jgi:hypothetical protein